MYCRLSASKMREPRAMSMNGGVPPTARNARTGEFTPPGMISCARWKSASDCFPIPRVYPLLPLLASNDQLEAGPDFIDGADFDVDKPHRQRHVAASSSTLFVKRWMMSTRSETVRASVAPSDG